MQQLEDCNKELKDFEPFVDEKEKPKVVR